MAHRWFRAIARHAWAAYPLTENAYVRIARHPAYPNRPGDAAAVLESLRRFRALMGHHFWPEDVSLLELVWPSLSIMDGVLGQEGEGPGARGTPRPYGCLAASRDPVALDAVMAQAMGYRSGQVLYLAEAGERNLGTADAGRIRIIGDSQALDFGRVRLPATHWYFRAPSWISAPIHRSARLRPQIHDSQCVGCGQCATVCPREVIEPGQPPRFDLDRCVGCMCCAEICPEGAIEARESIMARLTGAGI